MNIEIAIAPLIETLSIYIWPFVRIGAFLMVMPLVGSSFMPVRVRLLLAIALTIVIAPIVPPAVTRDVLSAAGLVTMIQEIANRRRNGILSAACLRRDRAGRTGDRHEHGPWLRRVSGQGAGREHSGAWVSCS